MKALTEAESRSPRLHAEVWLEDGEDRIERLRQAEIADWRRKYRRHVVSKVIWRVGLTFLICGSLLCVAYGFHV